LRDRYLTWIDRLGADVRNSARLSSQEASAKASAAIAKSKEIAFFLPLSQALAKTKQKDFANQRSLSENMIYPLPFRFGKSCQSSIPRLA
jgi:hypothetical protein